MRWLVVFALALALGSITCGGKASPPAVPPDDAPACDAVADHLVRLAESDNPGGAGAALAAGIRGESVRQCTEAPWSAARRACLVRAQTQEDTLACPEQ